MPRLLLIWIISLGLLLGTPQEKAKIPSVNPELAEGPWETSSGSQVDGIFITTVTGFDWQTINIRLYHRVDRKETWGYFGTKERATTESYGRRDDHSFTLFDGSRLRIHFADTTDLKPFDLDVIFSSTSHEWTGMWASNGQNSKVVLRRPQPKPGLAPNALVGDWMSSAANDSAEPGSIHVRQSTDGTLSAWLDRAIAPDDRRNGEFLLVLPSKPSELRLELAGAAAPSHHYHGILSGDGHTLTGGWAENNGATLNAPDTFRKAPG